MAFFLLKGRWRKPKYLALDGTSWEYGKKKIHLLTLSVVINKVSIPIWWIELDKKGISSFEVFERQWIGICDSFKKGNL